jgi:ABC-type multidrug transport system fused ATPase/permease subunit
MPPGIRSSRAVASLAGGVRGRVGALAALGVASGLGEAAVVMLVVAIAAGPSTELPVIGTAPGAATSGAVVLGVLGLLAAVHYASARLAARTAVEVEQQVQERLVHAYLEAPMPALAAVAAGELQDLVTSKALQVADGTQQAATAVATGVNLLVVVAVAFATSLWSTLLLTLALGTTLLAALPLRRRTRAKAQDMATGYTDLSTDVAETAAIVGELRVFGVGAAAEERVRERIAGYAVSHEQARRLSQAAPPLTRDVALCLLVVALLVIVESGELSLPVLGLTVVLVMRALAHAQSLASVWQRMAQRAANLEAIERRLAAWQPLEAPAAGRLPCARIDGVELRGVTHRYGDGDTAPALADVDLEIRRGTMLGVVGRTGAGKSTLASILLGLLSPTRGDVLANGTPVGDIDPSQWHALIAWVAQDPRLLTGTVRENIRFLRPGIADRDVEAAARTAGLGHEIDTWPDGLDRPVGRAGSSLSGGERQRVALARALAGRPDLIVLDEPTSALDAHSEAAMREALEELREQTAMVVIAHRLSTVQSCDRVAVLEGGRIVALGPPAEVEATNDWFRRAMLLSGGADPLR